MGWRYRAQHVVLRRHSVVSFCGNGFRCLEPGRGELFGVSPRPRQQPVSSPAIPGAVDRAVCPVVLTGPCAPVPTDSRCHEVARSSVISRPSHRTHRVLPASRAGSGPGHRLRDRGRRSRRAGRRVRGRSTRAILDTTSLVRVLPLRPNGFHVLLRETGFVTGLLSGRTSRPAPPTSTVFTLQPRYVLSRPSPWLRTREPRTDSRYQRIQLGHRTIQ